jgi:hypothetical protein
MDVRILITGLWGRYQEREDSPKLSLSEKKSE